MSHTTLYELRANGDVTEFKDYPNAWGSAVYVWSRLSERYLHEPWFTAMARDPDPLWRLVHNTSVSWAERIALVLTFDYVIVPRESLPTCVEAIRDFLTMHPNTQGHACHWPEFATDLRAGYERNALGFAWNQTSVSSPVWAIYNEETDESRPYNIKVDDKHFFIFDQYPELK